MRTVVQRVHEADCRVDGDSVGSIDHGLVVFLGVAEGDTRSDAETLARKIVELRVFPNDEGKMDHDVTTVNGDALVIPNFTLCADLNQGRRPGFDGAAPPDRAEELFEAFTVFLQEQLGSVQSGVFGAMMDITAVNDGPVTLVLDTERIQSD